MRFSKAVFTSCILLAVFVCVRSSHAFTQPVDTVGPLTLSIADPGEVTALGQPLRLSVLVRNAGAARLDGAVRLAGIDGWRIQEPARPFSIAPNTDGSDGPRGYRCKSSQDMLPDPYPSDPYPSDPYP